MTGHAAAGAPWPTAAALTLDEALNGSDDAVFVVGRETLQFLYVNRGAEHQLGYTRAELLSMSQPQIMPGTPEGDYRKLVAGLGPGASMAHSSVYRRKDGADLLVDAMVHVPRVENGPGRSPWLVSVARDVSERVKDACRAVDAAHELAARETRSQIADAVQGTVVHQLFELGLIAASARSGTADTRLRSQLDDVICGLDESIRILRALLFEPGPIPGHGVRPT